MRVLGTAERSQIDQGVRPQLHARVPLLDALAPQQEPLERLFPGTGPFDTHPQGMDGFVEAALASTLRALTVPGILWDVGDHARIEDQLPIVRSIKAAIKVEVGASQVSPDLFGHLLQGLQALGKEHHIRFIHGSHGDGSSHRAMIVDDGNDLLALLVFVPRVPDAIPPFVATVLVPSPWSTLMSRCFSAERCATLAQNACQSDPSSAHVAKAR